MADYIMALDQGTTSSRAIIFDKEGRICSVKQKEFTQHFPNNGWVEHDPMEIWATQMSVMMEARETMGIRTEDIAAIGITNQRETTIVWDRKTGNPVYHAIVWQCRRTADRIEQLKAEGYDKVIREKTGLIVDPYFSATKIEWILDNVPGARERAEAGELMFGTVAYIQAHRRKSPCNGLHERIAYYAIQHSYTGVGQGIACKVQHPGEHASGSEKFQ